MNDKRILKNIGISMLMKPISMLLSFVYTPLALSFLGQEKYGVWAIILNIISWINYFDVGIGNGLRNKLTETISKGEKGQAQTYVSTAYLCAILISTIFCIIITFFWNVFDLSSFFNLNLTDENTDFIVFISILFVCVNFVLSLSKTSAYAIQQPSIISVVGVIDQVLQICIVLGISYIMDSNLFVIAFMYGVITLFGNTIIYFFITRKQKYLIPKKQHINTKYMKPLLSLGLGFFALQICSLVLNTTDNLLISSLYGSAEVTPYNMVYKFFYVSIQVHAIVIMPMWSAYTEAATRKDIVWIKKTMKRINALTAMMSVCVVCGIFFFEPFARLWLGTSLEYGGSLIVIVAIYMIAQMFGNNYSAFLCGVGHIKVSTIISSIGALINIPLSFFFAQTCGMRLAGVILGSLFVMTISVVVLPITTRKWLNKKEMEWG